jgi:ribosomal protein L37AE/L43A
MPIVPDQPELDRLLRHYLERLSLPTECLKVTTDRAVFVGWVGRRVDASIGGAYAFLRQSGKHAVLINLERIDLARANALEIVVAEELVHMRDRLDGDLRRHAKHGHDRIAVRVAGLTGATLEEVRAALLPPVHRCLRYVYRCPTCAITVPRRIRGTWSCGRCAKEFDPRHVLRLVEDRGPARACPTGRS